MCWVFAWVSCVSICIDSGRFSSALFETCFGFPHDLDSFENVMFFHLYTLVKKSPSNHHLAKFVFYVFQTNKQSQIQDLSFLGPNAAENSDD